MIILLNQGEYKLVGSKGGSRLLILDDKDCYAWINANEIGEILVQTKNKLIDSYILSRGKYRIYRVTGENNLTDLLHLELYIGEGYWQGYLLPTGLPSKENPKNKIIPTKEIITEASRLRLTR